MDDEILTVDDAAAVLKIDPSTLVNLLMSGDLAGRNVGGQWLTTKRALVTFVDGLTLQGGCCGPGCCMPAQSFTTPTAKPQSAPVDAS